MERLTKRSSDTHHKNGVCCAHFGDDECQRVNGNCAADCFWEEAAWSRLADFEDFCKTPEKLKQILENVKEIYKDWKESVFVPCKVGDEIWLTIAHGVKLKEPLAARVVAITVGTENKFTLRTTVGAVYDSDLGKTAFGARWAAEKAIKRSGLEK